MKEETKTPMAAIRTKEDCSGIKATPPPIKTPIRVNARMAGMIRKLMRFTYENAGKSFE